MLRRLGRNLLICMQCLAFMSCAKETGTNGVATEGAEVGKWTMDIAAAAALAQQRDLPLLYNFTGSDWCQYCKIMQEQVFSKPEWTAYAAENLVLVTVDRPQDPARVPEKYRERNTELHQRYQIEGVPTYLVLDSDNETVLGRLGVPPQGPSVNAFLRQLAGALRHRPAEIARFVKGLSEAEAQEYRDLLEKQAQARKQLDAWLRSQPEQNETNNAVFAGFQKRLAELEQQIGRMELLKTLARLDQNGATETLVKTSQHYEDLVSRLMAARLELENWLLQRPEKTPANAAKLKTLTDKIASIHRELEAVGSASPPAGEPLSEPARPVP